MVRMIPDVISSEIKSPAEKKLFDRFKSADTDEKIVILHSLGVAEHVTNIFGEIDFVIICREGFLCVEVKGGIVERNGGIWTHTNRYGKRDSRNKSPFDQAQGNMQSLRSHMVTRLGEYHPFAQAQYANCVLMPDCAFKNEGSDINREILFDRSTGCNLEDLIRVSFSYWRSELQRQHGFKGGYLSDEEIDEAAALLRGDFRFVPALSDVIYSVYQELLALTDEQYQIMEGLDENPRLMISGLAGTGKSVLAVEQCKRAMRCGKSVLYLCYNRNMAQYVQNQFEKEKLDGSSSTLHALLENICGSRDDEHDSAYYQRVLPERFLAKDVGFRQYDLVVVDEGQDVINSVYLRCIDRLIKGGLETGCWAVYYDPNQNIYNPDSEMDREVPRLNALSTSFKVNINCRNTKEIANANTLLTNIPQVSRVKASGPKVEYRVWSSVEEEREQITDILFHLQEDGVKNNEIVILSPYALSNRKCFLNPGPLPAELGKFKTEGRMWGAKQNELRVSTIAAFKGLEAKVVICADLDNLMDSSRKLLNYVAVSRAQTLLYILTSSGVEQDRQLLMATGYPFML